MARLSKPYNLQQINNAAFDPFEVNVMDEKYWKTELSGVVTTDGAPRPLAGYFSSLSNARVAYPRFASGITSLNMQIDTCAIMEAYLDAAYIAKNTATLSGKQIRNNDYSSYICIRPNLIIPRRYYRVDLDKVWFYGSTDINAEGAVFIGHAVSGTGTNYHQFPDVDQPAAAGAVLSIGNTLHPSFTALHPYFSTDGYDYPSRNTIFRLPMLVSDFGYRLRSTDTGNLNDLARGIGLRIGGMHNTEVNVPGIYGNFRYGIVWAPIDAGASFNTIRLTEMSGPLVCFKFCPLRGPTASTGGYITSNRIKGGFNNGPIVGTGADPYNSGIIFDFDNQPHKDLNFPWPITYTGYWAVDDMTIEEFCPESNFINRFARINKVYDCYFKRMRGEGWDRGIATGKGVAAEGARRTPRDYEVEIDMGANHQGAWNIIFEDWYSAIPRIKFNDEYSNDYPQNVVSIRGKNPGNTRVMSPVVWSTEETYYHKAGTGPILTDVSGLHTYRIRVKNGALDLQEVGLPRVAARISGTANWTYFGDDINYVPISGQVGQYLEVLDLTHNSSAASSSSTLQWHYIDSAGARKNTTTFSTTDSDNDGYFVTNYGDTYYMHLTYTGVASLTRGEAFTISPVSGMNPYGAELRYITNSPPFGNVRRWPNAVYTVV